MMLFQIGGRLYHPPSLLSEGLKARMCIASFTPLSNHLCSTVSIFVFSNVMVWSGLLVCMCFETSDVVVLCFLCSPNLAFSERSVFPTYVASHSSQLILYAGPTTLSFPTGSFGWTSSWRKSVVGLKYVGIPYPPKVLINSSEKPLMYGIITGLFLSSLFTPVVTVVSSSLFFSLISSLVLSLLACRGNHCIPVPLSRVLILSFFLLGHSLWIWNNIIKERLTESVTGTTNGGGGPSLRNLLAFPVISNTIQR